MEPEQIKALQRTCARESWVWKDVAAVVEGITRTALRRSGVVADVSSREKEVGSLLRKMIFKKGTLDLSEIRDRAGVRAVVHVPSDIPAARCAIRDAFTVVAEEDTRDRLGADRLGYMGIHFDIFAGAIPSLDPRAVVGPMVCELQLKTLAQHSWSTMSHTLVYKAPDDLPIPVRRRVNRLVSLTEIFDDEALGAERAIQDAPGYHQAHMIRELERRFFQITGFAYDEAISDALVDAIAGMYSEQEVAGFAELLEDFVGQKNALLEHVYDNYTPEFSPLAYQPEALAIWERMEHGSFNVDALSDLLPLAMLEDLANMWGTTLVDD